MTKEYKIILTDCDGVLLDWERGFNKWMDQQGYTKQLADEYDVATAYGLEKDEAKRLVKQYNDSAWMGYLHPYKDARSGVAKLYENGYRFHCITSMSLDKKAKRLRLYNLENVFGKGVFKELICLDTGAEKDDALNAYKDSGLYWLEDKTENAECGLRYGLKSILIAHGHNADCDNEDIVQAADWAEIVDFILKN